MEEIGDSYNHIIYEKELLRIKVLVDTAKPLLVGFNLVLGDGRTSFVEFRYEGLSDFCYNCGWLDHINRYCGLYVPSSFRWCYTPSLRADSELDPMMYDRYHGPWSPAGPRSMTMRYPSIVADIDNLVGVQIP